MGCKKKAKKTPNPGSEEAIENGCICPVLDNHGGLGAYNLFGTSLFWINGDCKLHGGTNERRA